VILGFGFTWCTDVCPVTLAHLTQARRKLGPPPSDVQVVYVTVDPERDCSGAHERVPARLRSDFHRRHRRSRGARRVRKDYGIVAEEAVKAAATRFAHSSYTYLIDRRGQLRA
jgi:protein SCO1/2